MPNNMNIDKETLDKLLTLSDAEFKRKVSKAADAAGIQNDKLDKMLKDIKGVKKTLSDMSESDLKRVAKTISAEKLEDLIDNLKKDT